VREIVIDAETTGLDPLDGHRAVEIGALELVNRSPTGQKFYRYVCPERAKVAHAAAVHGITAEFLADKLLFGAVAEEFFAFVGYAPLMAHNAGFAIAFINAESKRATKPPIATERVVGTLVRGRRKHAGGQNTRVNSLRNKHGALLDAALLAAVYVDLTTTRQAALQLEPLALAPSNIHAIVIVRPLPFAARIAD